MKKKMINVLNWLKSRKTAFLSCMLVVCLGCSLIAVKRSNKQASAAVSERSERAFLIQTYIPPVLFFPDNSYSYFVFGCSPCFYIRESGFAWSTGAEYSLKLSSDFSTYTDYGTYFYYYSTSGTPVVQVIKTVRFWIGSTVSDWSLFYSRCMLNEYSLEVIYSNQVVNSTDVPDSDSSVFINNCALYSLIFTHKTNSDYDCFIMFYVSSMNAVRNVHDFKITSNVDSSDTSFSKIWFYTVSTSIINVSADNQYKQGYDDGYMSGEQSGYNNGQQQGYIDGRSSGLTEGEAIGYEKGLNENLSNVTPWQVIVDGVNSFANIEIFPGVKLSVIISIGFGVLLMGIVIKVFLGG